MEERTVAIASDTSPDGLSRRNFVRLAVVGGVTAMTLGLTGCGTESRSSSGDQNDSSAQTSPGASSAAKPAGAKTLVAVFSWSGHTLQVAERIKSQVDSDLFRMEPASPYTTDYDQVLDVAQDEQNRDYRPTLASTVSNWDEYDTIYLGYPVWWYHVPQVIKSFFDAHDFSGKTVHPFCTSGGSDISSTIPDLAALCPSMTLTDGLTIDGDSVSSSSERIHNWIANVK